MLPRTSIEGRFLQMAQYLTDFSEYEAGAAPHDWVEGWVPGEQRFEVAEVPGATGGKVLQHEVFAHNRRAWAWQAVPGASEVELLTRLRTNHQDSRFGVIARGGGENVRTTEEGVTLELFNGALRDVAEFEADKQELRTTLFLTTYNPAMEAERGPERPHGIGRNRGEHYYPWEPSTWYWLRLQVRDWDGYMAVRAKGWADGEAEPDWKYDIQRTEPAEVGRDGWVGITGQRTDGVREYDVFAVGTDGDPAPMP